MYTYLCELCTDVPGEAERGHRILWIGSHRVLGAAHCSLVF